MLVFKNETAETLIVSFIISKRSKYFVHKVSAKQNRHQRLRFPRLLPFIELETLTVNIPNSLYHYTTEYGLLAIIKSGVLFPSLERKDGRDALYGSGQYFTNISPDLIVCESKEDITSAQKEAGQICIEQLSYRIMGGVGSPERLAYFIELDVSNLIIEIPGTRYICLHRSEFNLEIRSLIIRSGKTLV